MSTVGGLTRQVDHPGCDLGADQVDSRRRATRRRSCADHAASWRRTAVPLPYSAQFDDVTFKTRLTLLETGATELRLG
jgi:hypothetical protein